MDVQELDFLDQLFSISNDWDLSHLFSQDVSVDDHYDIVGDREEGYFLREEDDLSIVLSDVMINQYNFNCQPNKIEEKNCHGSDIHCEVCGTFFPSVEGLKSHIKRFSTTLSCCCCGKTNVSMAKLSEHQVKHTQLRKYECGQCGKSFAYSKTLRKHQSIACKVNKQNKTQEDSIPDSVLKRLSNNIGEKHLVETKFWPKSD